MGRPPKVPGQKRKKQVKDPNKPKRATSAYFFFTAEKRAEAAAKGKPVKKVAEWTKEVSVLWRNLTPEQAQKFHDLAAGSKADYDAAMADYTGKQIKIPGAPKKPLSAYFLFLADFRRDNKDEFESNRELLQGAGIEWKGLSDEERKPYELQHVEEKKKYEVSLKKFNAENASKETAASANGASAPKKPKLTPAPPKQEAANGRSEDDDEEDEEEEEEGSEEEEEGSEDDE